MPKRKVKTIPSVKSIESFEINDDNISNPEIDEIRRKLKEKMKPSLKMELHRQKKKAIIEEKKRRGIYVEEPESESENEIDELNSSIDPEMDEILGRPSKTMQQQFAFHSNNNNDNLGQEINKLVSTSLEAQNNPNNKQVNQKVLQSVNSIIGSVMNRLPSNKSLDEHGRISGVDELGNKYNIFLKNNDKEIKPITMGNDNKDKNIDKNIEETDPQKIELSKFIDKAKITSKYKNEMKQYLDSEYDSEDEIDFDALHKKKEAEEQGIYLENVILPEDDEDYKDTKDVYLEIDLSVTDIDKFKDVIDKFEHHEKLLEAIQLSLKDQTIRERNLQYMTRRLKHLITKNLNKDIKECQKKLETKPKKTIKGGLNQKMVISDSLANLLGHEPGVEKNWVDITKEVWDYIKSNKLQDEADPTYIIPNDEFRKCFDIKKARIKHMDVSSYISATLKKKKLKTPNKKLLKKKSQLE